MCQGEIMFRCPIQLISVTSLTLTLSQFVDSFDLRNSGEEEPTQQDWLFLIKLETVQLGRPRISNKYQIGTHSLF